MRRPVLGWPPRHRPKPAYETIFNLIPRMPKHSSTRHEDTQMSIGTALAASIPFRSSGYGPHALLFIHGFISAAAVWEPVISGMEADLQKVTIDLPGMGRLSAYDGEISLGKYAVGVGRLLQEIGKPVVIVAQSMGAQIAELAASANPTLVRGLVLLTPVPLRGVNAPLEAVAAFKQLGGEPVLQRQMRRNLSHSPSAEAERRSSESAKPFCNYRYPKRSGAAHHRRHIVPHRPSLRPYPSIAPCCRSHIWSHTSTRIVAHARNQLKTGLLVIHCFNWVDAHVRGRPET
jgi:pimeloyl-ACP methyl ester carboxylesterase